MSDAMSNPEPQPNIWLTIAKAIGFMFGMVAIPLLLFAGAVWGGIAAWRRWASDVSPWVWAIGGAITAAAILIALVRRSGKPVPAPTRNLPESAVREADRERCPALERVRQDLVEKSAKHPDPIHAEVQRTLDEVTLAISRARAALSGSAPDALAIAAAQLVACYRGTGMAWAKYLVESDEGGQWIAPVREAWRKDAQSLSEDLERRLHARSPAAIIPVEDKRFALTCVACSAAAVTFQVSDDHVESDTFGQSKSRKYPQADAARISELLKAGDGAGLTRYLAPDGKTCDAYCPECALIYCSAHQHVETEWSGSWLVATHAKCPLGHAREID